MILLEVLIQSDKEGNSGRTTPDLTLYWDSWDSVTKTPHILANQQNNENAMQNSLSSLHSNNTSLINLISQPLPPSDNRFTPPQTPSFTKGKGKVISNVSMSFQFQFLLIDFRRQIQVSSYSSTPEEESGRG